MRWMRNTILIVVGLGLLIILLKSGEVNYVRGPGGPFAGDVNYLVTGDGSVSKAMAVIALSFPSSCSNADLSNFWDSSFNADYASTVLDLEIKNGVAGVVDGVCRNFAIYNISEDNFLVYVSQNYTSVDQSEQTYFVAVNLSESISFPTGHSDLIYNLSLWVPLLKDISENRLNVPADASEAGLIFSSAFLFDPQGLTFDSVSDSYRFSDQENTTDFSNTTVNTVGNISEFTFTSYIVENLPGFFGEGVVFIGTIPDFNTSEDVPIVDAFDLDDHFLSNGSIDFDFNLNMSNTVTFSVDSTNLVTINPVLDWYGIVDVNVTASSGGLSNTSNNFIVNVAPINDPPRLYNNIPNYTWSTLSKTINLDDFFIEIEGESLTFNSAGSGHIRVQFSDSDNDAAFVQEVDWIGTETMTIFANDTQNQTTESNVFRLTVTSGNGGVGNGSGNTAPVISSKTPSTSTVTMEVGDTQTFTIGVNDADNDTLTYSWTVNNYDQTGATSNFYVFTATSEGDFDIYVNVNDGFYTVSATWDVVVNAAGYDSGDVGDGANGPQGESQIIQKPKSSFTTALIIVIIVVVFIVGAIFVFRFLSKKSRTVKTTFEVKSSEERAGEPSSQESDFFEQLRIEELKPIISFIKRYRVKGAKDGEIRSILLKKGWKKEMVEEAFSKL